MAATRLAACALYPPMLPAIADPTRFLLMFTSTKASVLVFKTCRKRTDKFNELNNQTFTFMNNASEGSVDNKMHSQF